MVGEHANAAQKIPELPRLFRDNGTGYYYAASQLQRCIRVVRADASLPESERTKLAAVYADQAVAMLAQLLKGDHKEADRIRSASWPLLQDRDDFKKLRTELEARERSRGIR